MMPVVSIVRCDLLILQFGVEIVQVQPLHHHQLVYNRSALLEVQHDAEDVLQPADVGRVLTQFDHLFGGEVAPEELLKEEDVVSEDLEGHVHEGRVPLAEAVGG